MSGSSGNQLEFQLNAAQAALSRGDFAVAENICRELLGPHERNSRVHLILGIAAAKHRRFDEAISEMSRANELAPGDFETMFCLASAYRKAGNPSAAIAFGEQATRLRPNEPAVLSELGSSYLEANRHTEAETYLRNATRLAPASPTILLSLAKCLESQGRASEAVAIYRRAITVMNGSSERLLATCKSLRQQNYRVGALEFALESVRVAPKSLVAQAQVALSLAESDRHQEAKEYVDRPELVASNEPDVLIPLAVALQDLGRIGAGRECFLRAAHLKPSDSEAFAGYVMGGKIKPSDRELVDRALKEVGRPDLDVAKQGQFHSALGKAFEDLGEYEPSMHHYNAANRADHLVRFGGVTFDRNAFADSIGQTIALFPLSVIEEIDPQACQSEVPVFVVGMIRSGTTLIEQILTAHPEIDGIGEDPFWPLNGPNLVNLKATGLDTGRLRIAAKRYVGLIEDKCAGVARIIDKMPSNCNTLGFIYCGLPNARIIHIRRNPIDTCVSIYMTPNRSNLEFVHDKGDLAFAYRQYQRLMEHWREVLPADRFLEVDYEELVANTEPVVRQMVAFLGLDWDEACLRPEDNEHTVSTPSFWQVRQPIYKSSVARWKKFEPWLGELLTLNEN